MIRSGRDVTRQIMHGHVYRTHWNLIWGRFCQQRYLRARCNRNYNVLMNKFDIFWLTEYIITKLLNVVQVTSIVMVVDYHSSCNRLYPDRTLIYLAFETSGLCYNFDLIIILIRRFAPLMFFLSSSLRLLGPWRWVESKVKQNLLSHLKKKL